jgi:putative ATP-dependent endonuclease of OLD family
MYLSMITIENFRCFGEGDDLFELPLRLGLTALVGENEAGKTAVIDAIRFVFGTTDQERYWLQDSDFRKDGDSFLEIKIVCKFEGLNAREKRTFVEYLTYGEHAEDEPTFYINWTAKDTGDIVKGRPYRRIQVHSGEQGNGPTIAPELRDLLRVTYLQPLRNADQALSAGRGSRLAQILRHSDKIRNGRDACDPATPLEKQELSVLGISNLVNDLLGKQAGVTGTRDEIDTNLEELSLRGDTLKSNIKVGGAPSPPDARVRELLQKLDLRLDGEGNVGLGSNNLLFMACELLLLSQENEGNNMLLIEEPEVHLHAQRQLRVMKFMQEQTKEKGMQIIVTTHSPNLASAIKLNNIVMIRQARPFPMAEGHTKLAKSDYRFLERFLDVTKANLFFAKGVMIVEGDAENILLPTLAKIVGRDFTERGVSIVNVGGLGLHRYARIFQREHTDNHEQVDIPVACITDMDVMPNCAPAIIGKVKEGDDWPDRSNRRWRAKSDIGDSKALASFRTDKESKASGQYVRTFVSDEWTFEYDLALGPKDKDGNFSATLAKDVFVCACLADEDDSINSGKKTKDKVEKDATECFSVLEKETDAKDDCTKEEVLASQIYAKFAKKGVSKTIAAQYLAERLHNKRKEQKLTSSDLRKQLPKYLINAIDYVTGKENLDNAVPNAAVTKQNNQGAANA